MTKYTRAHDMDSWLRDPRIAARGFAHRWHSSVEAGNGEDIFMKWKFFTLGGAYSGVCLVLFNLYLVALRAVWWNLLIRLFPIPTENPKIHQSIS